MAVATPSLAQTIDLGSLECLPLEDNAALTAAVSGDTGGSTVRLFFRRLNPVGGFYNVEMLAAGGGAYWTTFPKPEEREQPELTDEWWELLKDRDWMQGHDRAWLEDWLDQQEYEAAEYYAALYDAAGTVTARSDTRLVVVREDDDCAAPPLDMMQEGWAQNLTIGETTPEQIGEPVFHWLCDGIVTRINYEGIYRADEYCRACVVGIGFFPPVAAAAGGVVLATTTEASPRQP